MLPNLDNERKALQNCLDSVEREELRLRRQQFAHGTGLLLTRFTVFLLFGGQQDAVDQIIETARGYVGNMEALIVCDASNLDAAALAQQVNEARNLAAQGAPLLDDLLTVRLCPVLFLGEDGVSDRLVALEMSLVDSHLAVEWMPFAICDLSTADSAALAAGVADLLAFLHHKPGIGVRSFLCGLFTTQSNSGYRCEPEHLLHTIALLGIYVCTSVAQADAMYFHLRNPHNKCLFYTAGAQSVRYPLLSCLYDALISAFEHFAGSDESIETKLGTMDIKFVKGVMDPYLNKLPRDSSGALSLMPVLGIMPGVGFEDRLHALLSTVYRPSLRDNKRDQLNDVAKGFLRSFLKHNGSANDVYNAYRDNEWKKLLDDLSQRARGMVTIAKLPEGVGNGADIKDWKHGCALLREKLEDLLPSRLRELIESDVMKCVDGNTDSAMGCMNLIRECLTDRNRLQSVRRELKLDSDNLRLQLLRELDAAAEAVANDQFDECQLQLMTQPTHDDRAQIVVGMVGVCYNLVRSRLVSDGEYMRQLHEVCRTNPDRAANYARMIKERCEFPVQLIGNIQGEYYAMGTEQNISTMMARYVDPERSRYIPTGSVIDVIYLSDAFELSSASIFRSHVELPEGGTRP